MPSRYRCCWCGSAVAKSAKTMRKHILERHRAALLVGLAPIEAFGTREEAIAP